ncbi:hypothetical protein HFN97_26155 [Rhizobium laguerreae]|uniref:hypothetical protein n=1 Tax=Rhizobium laguerreae TaxID=1076926 RepID=UPI001C90398C|nr:hypothetical protein [Rhizobium laguerreae]MBY3361259.1 hypothetical protein [Rhizobium laguerreae]
MTEDEVAKITSAAVWLAAQKEQQCNVFTKIRAKFDISAVQAAKACSLAKEIRLAAVSTGGRP